MKTTFKTLTDSKKAIIKRNQFQDKTGLKWDYYSTGQGMRFTPVVTRETPQNEQAAKDLLPHLTTDYQEFTKLAEVSGLNLADVLTGAMTLAKTQRAIPTVNRMGNFYAIRTKQRWEK